MIVDHVLEGSTPSLPSNLQPLVPSFGFVAQMVEQHVEGVRVAVSKSAEATKLSACSLVWLRHSPWERDNGSSNLPAQTKTMHLWRELDEPPRYERGLR